MAMAAEELDILVTDPTITGPFMRHYVTYRIVAVKRPKASTDKNSSYSRPKEINTCRRYREFAWFRQLLIESVPGRIIPPLPPPSILCTYRPDPVSIELRRSGLERFLQNLAAGNLKQHPLFEAFIEEKDFYKWVDEAKGSFIDKDAIHLINPGLFSTLDNSKVELPRNDEIDKRLEETKLIHQKLVSFKAAFEQYEECQSTYTDALKSTSRAFATYLDAGVEGEQHAKLIQYMAAIDQASSILCGNQIVLYAEIETITRDYLAWTNEVKRAFDQRRRYYCLWVHLCTEAIDTEAKMLQAQISQDVNFDRNYRLAECLRLTRVREGEAKQMYDKICRNLTNDLDALDFQRIREFCELLDTLMQEMEFKLTEIVKVWESLCTAIGNAPAGNILPSHLNDENRDTKISLYSAISTLSHAGI